MIFSGVAANKKQQKISLEWISKMSLNENCIKSFANHDTDIKAQVIEF